MNSSKKIEWLLRIGLAGSFIGHGAFALQGKETWLKWIMDFTGFDPILAGKVLLMIGIVDVIVGILLILLPLRIIILWVIIWTGWTAIMRILPFIGDPIWELLEKIIGPMSAIALLLVRGFPRTMKEWFK